MFLFLFDHVFIDVDIDIDKLKYFETQLKLRKIIIIY